VPSIAKGLTQQFAATGIYTDNTTQDLTTTALWSSSTTATSTISNATGSQGAAFASAVGTTTITATSGTISGNTLFMVTPAVVVSIQVTSPDVSVAKGLPEQFTATGTFTDNSIQDVTAMSLWASSVTGVATISNAAGSQGLASTTGTGTTSISATIGVVSGSSSFSVTPAVLVSITVTPGNPPVSLGLHQQFTATGTYTDSSTQNLTTTVTWASATTSVATISNAAGSNGFATTAAIGTSLITATLGSISGSTTLTVTGAVLVSIAVTPTNPGIPKGLTQQFAAMGTFTDSTTQDLTTTATWFSATGSVASISNAGLTKGKATALNLGTSSITAVSSGISSNIATMTVTAAVLESIAVTPSGVDLAIGATQQFTATGTFSDLSTGSVSVSWSSTSTGAITINASGLATAVGTSDGSSTIKATSGAIVGSIGASSHVSWANGTSRIFSIMSCGDGGSGCHSPSGTGTIDWTYTGNAHTTYTSFAGSGVRLGVYSAACTGSPPAMPPDGSGFPLLDATACALFRARECSILGLRAI
jgi:hypothetical protein